jgi:putative membrane protein
MSPQVTWHPHPDVWLLMISLVVCYVLAITKLGPRLSPLSPPASTRQKVWFFAGIGVMWIASDAPIHDLSENYLFSVHMVQHLLLTLVAPGMILMGMPSWLLRWMFSAPKMFAALKFFTRPLVAFIIFNALVAITHWPTVVNGAVSNELVHFSVHLVLVASAFAMWWPVINPLPEIAGLSSPAKMLYLFGQSILPTVPASFLTFAEKPLYSTYASFPRMWGLSAETDQMIAGLIMKLGGGLLLWGIIAAIFFRWHAREEKQEHEPIGWDDFENSLKAWDLRRT